MMKARRFVNVVTDRYLLSRIRLKNNLFYRSAAEAQQHAAANKKINNGNKAAAVAAAADVLRLPPSELRLKPSSRPSFTRLNFMPFYGAGGEGNVLCVNESGHTALYDADASTVEMMPGLISPMGCHNPISFSVARIAGAARPEALYVLESVFHSHSPSRFAALVYDDPNPNPSPFSGKEEYAWHWRPLPPPPVHLSSLVDCHTLLHAKDGGGTIYVSYTTFPDPIGTYRFDTGTGEWTKAGDWSLPFFSQAVHVPELGDDLLFGVERHHPYRFCAMDASGLGMNKIPVLRHAWLDIVDPPPDWFPGFNSMAYLGDGRFCIHRRFDTMAEYGMESVSVGTVVLLTGVEVVRSGSRLRMIKHKSKRLDCEINHVL